MPGPAFLSGDRLTLRPLEAEDHEFVHRHENHESIRRWIHRLTPRSREDVVDDLEDASTVSFLPCLEGKSVGRVWFFRIDDVARHAEVGYWIVEDERGNGYATEALELAVRYAFEDRGLHKVLARVFEGNVASARVLERVGFREEGRLHEHYRIGGEPVDAILYGLLEDDRDRDLEGWFERTDGRQSDPA